MTQYLAGISPEVLFIGAMLLAMCSIALVTMGILKANAAYHQWSQRNHPVEKLVRHAEAMLLKYPDDFSASSASYNCVEAISDKHRINIYGSTLKVDGRRLPLSDHQEKRIRTAGRALYQSRGGSAAEYQSLWMRISGTLKIVDLFSIKKTG